MFQFYLNRWVQREKQKNAKIKPNTKGENWESVRPLVTVCDAVRRSHPTLVCVFVRNVKCVDIHQGQRHVHTALHRLSKQLLTEQMPWFHTQRCSFSSDVPLLYSVYI